MNRTVLTFFIVLCLSSASSFSGLAFEIQPVKAVVGTVYIRADGRVEGTTSIQTADNVTYVFLANINDSIVVERGNIIIDGEGFTVQGSGSGKGFSWSGISNVTVKNTNIKSFYYGIYLYSSSNNSISGNNITNNTDRLECGIYLGPFSNNNSISGNNITNNDNGVWLRSSNNNSISGNNITANNSSGITVFYSSNNNSISGNNITNNGFEGIGLCDSFENSVSGNNITNNGFGVWFDCANHNSVSGNSIANSIIGIKFDSNDKDAPSKYNSISGNSIANNVEGIEFGSSSNNNSISGNNFAASSFCGIFLDSSSNTSISGNTFTDDGLAINYSYHNFVESNTVNGKPLVYLEGISDYSVSDAGQVILVNCDSIRVEGLNLSKANRGVQLLNTTNSIIARNTIANNDYGVVLDSSSNNSISGNNIANNDYGVVLDSSSDNNVYHNNFVENTLQVYGAGSINVWDNGCEGNYWSNYNGTDSNGNGVGETPYAINQYDIDNYPLMNVYWNPADINHDLIVNMKDVGTSAKAFNTVSGDLLWNPHADITGIEPLVPDGTVDMRDIGTVARHFGDRYP